MQIDDIIRYALHEDIGDGDHTSLSTIPENAEGKARLLIKANGVLAGLDIGKKVFQAVDPSLNVQMYTKDGKEVVQGDVVMDVTGKAISILTAERLALNFMQRMSGIATHTRYLVNMVRDYPCRLLDTRKTTPLLRELEKYAVRMGGGENHRMGLYDMIMIKDNHVDFAGGIREAISACSHYLQNKGKNLAIEIEVRNFKELQQVLNTGGVDRIMLDNFSPQDLKTAIDQINGKYETEASGGITENNLVEYAQTRVDFISIGALTHRIKSLDMSLVADF